jgi:hypothetical protein
MMYYLWARATIVHYLWAWLEPIGRHLIVDKGLWCEEAMLRMCITLYIKISTLYFNTCLLRKKLLQALTYMVLNYGWRKKECFSNELFVAYDCSCSSI